MKGTSPGDRHPRDSACPATDPADERSLLRFSRNLPADVGQRHNTLGVRAETFSRQSERARGSADLWRRALHRCALAATHPPGPPVPMAELPDRRSRSPDCHRPSPSTPRRWGVIASVFRKALVRPQPGPDCTEPIFRTQHVGTDFRGYVPRSFARRLPTTAKPKTKDFGPSKFQCVMAGAPPCRS